MPQQEMPQFVLRQDTVDGFALSCWEAGDGPTLLFLHGAGGAADFFAGPEAAPFLRALAQKHRVLVTEHPGFGGQDRPDWVENIHDLAYFYADYLKFRDLSQVHLVGQSLGGWLALEMAVRDTSRLASLTLAGAAGLHLPGVPKGDIFLWSREDFANNMFRTAAAAQRFRSHVPAESGLRAGLRNRETTALLAWQPRLHDPHLHKWLHRIDAPTHVIWADDDAVLPLPYAQALVAAIPGARLSVIAQAGHLLHTDQPQAFSAAIAGFIARPAQEHAA